MIRLHWLFILSLSTIAHVQAKEVVDHDVVRDLKEQGVILPLVRLIDDTEASFNATLVDAQLFLSKGAYIYRLKIVDAKRQVWEVDYDAKSGIKLNINQAFELEDG